MKWHYITKDKQQAEADDSAIRSLVESGEITKETGVWNETLDAWKAAGETSLVELFPAAAATPPAPAPSAPVPPRVPAQLIATPAPVAAKSGEWFYLNAQNQKVGPISEQQTILFIGNGTIKRTTSLWNASLTNWVPAAESTLGSLFATMPNSVGADLGEFLTGPALIYPSNPPRSIGWMSFWGFIMPGLGQLLCGQIAKGCVMLLGGLVLCLLLAQTIVGPIIVGFVGYLDAKKIAKKLASGRPVRQWEFFPE